MAITKTTKVFKSGNSQAVRLPKEFRFSVDEVEIFRRGDEIVLREKPKNLEGLFRALAALGEDGDFMPEGREQPPMQERDFSLWDKEEK
ncbi:MAG: AbrB/MazE/SpoVT family DNA-binding domain-containing protein [Meiothermus sp.]